MSDRPWCIARVHTDWGIRLGLDYTENVLAAGADEAIIERDLTQEQADQRISDLAASLCIPELENNVEEVGDYATPILR